MSGFQFSTVDKNNAQTFLNHESFNYLHQSQKDLILNNLGKIRVLDPYMHGGGKVSFECSELMIEYIKLGGVQDPKSFMFTHCYLSPNFELIKWGLDQGFEFYQNSLDRLVSSDRTDILDYLLDRGVITKESMMFYLGHYASFKTMVYYAEKFNLKKISSMSSACEKYSNSELLQLWDKKLVTGKDLSYHCHEKYLQINKIRTARNKKSKEDARWATFLNNK